MSQSQTPPASIDPSTPTRMSLKDWAAVCAALFMFGFGVHQYIRVQVEECERHNEALVEKMRTEERDRNQLIYQRLQNGSSRQ